MGTVLVTGAAGFIGHSVCVKLIGLGHRVIGIDNLNDYYDVNLKISRLENINSKNEKSLFSFQKLDITNDKELNLLFENNDITTVINLAAQAGVRYSIENPQAYIDTNVTGFQNILNACKTYGIKHIVYASSSSVYGDSTDSPFKTSSSASHPVSMYAATKRMNELMAHVFASQYNIPCTGLRFFTVYGPWGRPDMAPIKFAKAIASGEPIDVYNYGEHYRDFTYIDDIVDGILRVWASPPKEREGVNETPESAVAPFKVYNIGAQTPVHLMEFIDTLESELGKKAIKNMLPMQPGDVKETYADVSMLVKDHKYKPETKLKDGVKLFIDWFKEYNQ